MKSIFTGLATMAVAMGVTHESPQLCCGWNEAKLADAHAQGDVSFTFSVQEQNMDRVHDLVAQVSDPKSDQYGQYLSGSEILAMTAPKKADVVKVVKWLQDNGMKFRMEQERHLHVTASVPEAERLLNTNFRVLVNEDTNEQVLRAGAYAIPDEVDAVLSARFGLHGVPLPNMDPLIAPGQPAAVTPSVLSSTYDINGVKPSGSDSNRQAVAEFQGQYEKDTDLAQFFKQYVPNAQAGDDKVSKFVGSKDQQQAGIEASLDIQYIMGVAPHIKTEFWLFAGQDFCKDLQNWTATMLSDDSAPSVHSVSYGWQGNLTQIGCANSEVSVVDGNFAKLALKGITIIFASGDSGSGYAPPRPDCSDMQSDTVLTGTVSQTLGVPNPEVCCQVAASGAGYSFVPSTPTPGPKPSTCTGSDIGQKDTVFTGSPPTRNIIIPAQEPSICCRLAGEEHLPFFSVEPSADGRRANCSLWKTQPPSTKHASGGYSGRGASPGTCQIYSTITGKKAETGAFSGEATKGKVTLYPSWPASSPYVTAVGATRFVDQKVGQPEMATDQFGSGGGFSSMFKQSDHAQWQIEAVSHYTSNPPQDPHYPPAGSFDPQGRATPDVCALGEGYEVVANGKVEPVGGTSASAPAFAGMVALLNEARQQAGKGPLGFLNPFLYQNADCFTDVTLGTNAIGRGNGPIKYGFNATAGWDPATGLGSPVFSKLLTAVKALP